MSNKAVELAAGQPAAKEPVGLAYPPSSLNTFDEQTIGEPVERARRTSDPRLLGAAVCTGLIVMLGSWVVWPLAPIGVVFLLGTFLFICRRWPTEAVIATALSAIVARGYFVYLMPERSHGWINVLSNGMVAVALAAIGLPALFDGRVGRALRHPVVIGMIAFVLIMSVSALVNAVPLRVAALGLAAYLDTFVIFSLILLVPWTRAHVVGTLIVLSALLAVAAVIALCQAVLGPGVISLPVFVGRFGEGARIGSLFIDPNIFGSLLDLVLPFWLGAFLLAHTRRGRIAAMSVFILFAICLVLAHSRGALLGFMAAAAVLIIGFGKRGLAALTVGVVISVAIASILPRNVITTKADIELPDAEPPTQVDVTGKGFIGSTIARVQVIFTGKDLRTRFIANAVPIIADNPLVGVGPGRYGGAVAHSSRTPVYREYRTNKLFTFKLQTTVDDFWLHLLGESGPLGFLPFLLPTAVLAWLAVRMGRREPGPKRMLLIGAAAVVIAFWFDNLTTMLLEGNLISQLYWFFVGLTALLVTRTFVPEPAVSSTRIGHWYRDWLPPEPERGPSPSR